MEAIKYLIDNQAFTVSYERRQKYEGSPAPVGLLKAEVFPEGSEYWEQQQAADAWEEAIKTMAPDILYSTLTITTKPYPMSDDGYVTVFMATLSMYRCLVIVETTIEPTADIDPHFFIWDYIEYKDEGKENAA